MIWPRFNTKLNGFIALIWLLIGLAATNLLRFHYGVSFSLFGFILWLFFVWFGPVLLLAFSALGMGSVANRICGVLSILLILMGIVAVFLPAFYRPKGNSMIVCNERLKEISLAKALLAEDDNLTNGTFVKKEQLLPYFHGKLPQCPQGGEYYIGKIGESPRCSFPQHKNIRIRQ